MLVGRVTYEAAEEMDLSHAERTYVFSRTMTGSVPENVTIIRDDAETFVRTLKDQDGKGICLLGGGDER